MNKVRWKYNVNDKLLQVLVVLLFLSSLNNVANGLLSQIGFVSMMSLLLISSFSLLILVGKEKNIEKRLFEIGKAQLLIISILLLGLLMNSNLRAFLTTFQYITVISTFLFFSKHNVLEKVNEKLFFICFMIMLGIHGFYFIGEPNTTTFSSIFENQNTLGIRTFLDGILLILLYFKTFQKRNILLAILFFLLSLASGARSVFIIVGIATTTYFIFNFISKNRLRWNVFLILNFVILILFTYIYPRLDQFDNFHIWNDIVVDLTGQRIFTGRNRIWIVIFEYISASPILGHGTGILLNDISNITLSAHNHYLQILLQNGWFGLMTIFILFLKIWNGLYLKSENKIVKFISCFFIGILYYNLFEVTLFQNNISIGLVKWFIVSIGINMTAQQKVLSIDLSSKRSYEKLKTKKIKKYSILNTSLTG